MKKILFGLLAISTFSVFAQFIVHENVLESCNNDNDLLKAVKSQNIKMLNEVLRNEDENLEIKDCRQRSPLLISQLANMTEIFKRLFEKGARIDLRYNDALYKPNGARNENLDLLTISALLLNEEIFNFLIDKNFLSNLNDKEKDYLFWVTSEACTRGRREARQGDNFCPTRTRMLSTLIKYKVYKYYEFGFCWSVRHGYYDIVKEMINSEIINSCGPALAIAVDNGDLEIINLLIKEGADVNKPTPYWGGSYQAYTPLMIAVYKNNIQAVKMLIDSNANIFAEGGSDNENSLEIAISKGYSEIFQILLDAGAIIDFDTANLILSVSAKNGDQKMLENAIKSGADVNFTVYGTMSSLMLASKRGYLNIVKKLIDNKANVNLKMSELEGSDSGMTALLFAAKYSKSCIVDELVKAGAKLNVSTERGGWNTPLMWAARRGELDTVQVLIKAGADIHQRNGFSYTALEIAKKFQHDDVVNFLISAGAKF